MFGNYTVKELKEQLVKRRASTHGKKKDLFERLLSYERNNSFQQKHGREIDVPPPFSLPPDSAYKYVTASTELPPITKDHVDQYLLRFAKDKGPAEEMYKAKFLIFLRHASENNYHFLRGLVGAQLKKNVNYYVDVKINKDGTVHGAICECAVGADGLAHCKHVVIVLLSASHMFQDKEILLQLTCTRKLQSFHRPKKTYQGSPLKAEAMAKPKRNHSLPAELDPRSLKYRNTGKVNERVKNTLCLLKRNTSIKQLGVPTNVKAAVLDHIYSSLSVDRQFLIAMKLNSIEKTELEEIEVQTRGQAKNKLWHEYRKCRITASTFYRVCKSYERGHAEACKNLSVSLLNPISFHSKALEHGILNEAPAVKKLMQEKYRNLTEARERGLFLHENNPFIGASPDRLIAKVTLVEVKCPISAKDKLINPSTVPYLYVNEEGSLSLKKNHPYYYQVQGQLAVTKRKIFEFVVYIYCDMKVIEIMRDEDFIIKMINSLTGFYENFFKPALLEKFLYKSY